MFNKPFIRIFIDKSKQHFNSFLYRNEIRKLINGLMRKFKFQTRLIIGFSCILLFSFIIAFLSIYQIRLIRLNSEAMYRHPLTVSNSVRDINISINAIHRSMKDVVLSENKTQLDESILLVNQNDKLIRESFTIVRDRFLGDKQVVDAAYRAYINWELIRNEVINLKSAGKNQLAANITKGKGAIHVKLLFQKTKVLTDFAQNKADEFYLNTQKSEQKSVAILIWAISIILFLAALISVVISRSISKPVHKFLKEIESLYRKEDPQKNKDFHNRSEQEIFEDIALELKNAYHELKSFNKELDTRIDIRTKELKIAKEKAEESDHLKSAFLANMSHEIRTPLNSILGFSEFLKSDNLEQEKRKLYLEMIQSGGEKLLTIISDIVDISKIDAKLLQLHIDNYNLNHCLFKLYQQFSIDPRTSNIELKIHTQLNDDNSCIQTDETRLSQIISNLLENAVKFTTRGKIEFGYTKEEDNLLFFVKDTGIGISPIHHQTIFKRFRQSDTEDTAKIEGTGLGLSIAKGLVELFGGKIWVDSVPGKGANFYFRIPHVPAIDCCKVSSEISNTPDISENTTILVAEDEQSNYIYIHDLLKKYHYNVIRAKNGKEALKQISANKHIDLILMDIKMPLMNGIDATKEIRKINKNIPVIAQTAYAMADDKKKALEAGCNDYLAKPISVRILTNILHKHLN